MTAATRIAEIRARAAARMCPQLVTGLFQPEVLNAPLQYKMVSVPDPDLDVVWLCDRLERAEQLLNQIADHYETELGEYRSAAEVRAFLAGGE
jgi:hypothetical protein